MNVAKRHEMATGVVGTGVDLVEVRRLREAVSRWGDRFLKRVFSDGEIAHCGMGAQCYERLAGRFAAKEAVRKALGSWWYGGSGWKSIEIIGNQAGQPEVFLSGEAARAASRGGVEKVFLTLSHEASHAVAHAILVGPGPHGGVKDYRLSLMHGRPKVATGAEMREIDRTLIQDWGVPSILLMENAGRAVAEAVLEVMSETGRGTVGVVCGKGNNGGDGLVAARHLAQCGVPIKVFLAGRVGELKGDPRTNLKLAAAIGIKPVELANRAAVRRVVRSLPECKVLVDAILGTGVKGEVAGLVRDVIEGINASRVPVVSVDMPSGVDGDTGRILGCAVRAARTVTLGYLKRGLVLFPGAGCSGSISVAGLGLTLGAAGGDGIHVELLTRETAASLLPPRPAGGHKGTFGHVLVVAGSRGLAGAAALAGMGALRTGSGLVTVASPESLNPIIAGKLTEVMTRPLPETREATLSLDAEKPIRELARRVGAIAIGPGLSTHEETIALVARLLNDPPAPLVVDADALAAVGRSRVRRKASGPGIVLTPHPGEMARMLGRSAEDIQADRIGVAEEVAARLGVVVVLKGARTIVAERKKGSLVNPTGCPAMATGGMGDVLTGMVASLVGQGLGCFEAASCGVFVHGLAAENAAALKAADVVTASEVLERVPSVLAELRS